MILETHAVPPFAKNGFVLGCDETREGVIIDPGDEVETLLELTRAHGLRIRYILLTHAHLDHITGVGRARTATNAEVCLHRDDQFLYDRVVQQGIAFGLHAERQPPVDRYVENGSVWSFGRLDAVVHHTPGHSPGGVCLQVGLRGERGLDLFVGDTLFAGSIGRTDLPGGDVEILLTSIRTVLIPFGDDARVYPGHGPFTTIGEERRTNPFLA
jgi:hydroxyacylglutathione hydrolase